MLSSEFWQGEKKRLLAELLPKMEELAIAGVTVGLDKLARFGITFDSALAHAEAAAWARTYTDDLLDKLGTTNRRVVGEVLSNWVETPGATMGDLTTSLQRVLDANVARANLIAVTETTRAFAEGEALTYGAAGIPKPVYLPPAHPHCHCGHGVQRLPNGELVVVWLTNRDEKVCTRELQTSWGAVKGCRDLFMRIISPGPWLGMKFADAASG